MRYATLRLFNFLLLTFLAVEFIVLTNMATTRCITTRKERFLQGLGADELRILSGYTNGETLSHCMPPS